MCKHLENCPEYCCMQCFSENNGVSSPDFFMANAFAQSIAKTIEKESEDKKAIQLLDVNNFKPDYQDTSIKIKLLQK